MGCEIKRISKLFMITIINILHASISELYKDYNTNENSFKENFSFSEAIKYSDNFIDLDERKAFFNLMILTCNKMCLSDQMMVFLSTPLSVKFY